MRTDGIMVADSWSDLIDGSLDNAISKNEFGANAPSNTWTGSQQSGGLVLPNCSDWTSSSAGVYGRYGSTSSTSSSWSDLSGMTSGGPCNVARALYCFQE
jgi:hypothetical protein